LRGGSRIGMLFAWRRIMRHHHGPLIHGPSTMGCPDQESQ
jgi:hypothetical protein